MVGEAILREVLVVLTFVVGVFGITESVLVLFVDRAVESLLPADEEPLDAVSNVEDVSLAIETGDWGLETESVWSCSGVLVTMFVFDGVETFRSAETRGLG